MENRVGRKTERREPLTAIAETIVSGRFVIFALFAVAAVFCALTLGRVKVNPDLTAFLPEETETRRGVAVMDEEFETYGAARILIENVPADEATEIARRIGEIDHVAESSFDETEAHYKDGNALISVSFDEGENGEGARAAMEEIRAYLADLPYKTAVSSAVGYDYQSVLAKEMVVVLALSAAVIVAVLLFTSRSYFEVVIFFIVFISRLFVIISQTQLELRLVQQRKGQFLGDGVPGVGDHVDHHHDGHDDPHVHAEDSRRRFQDQDH